jgi:hypothetical protein
VLVADGPICLQALLGVLPARCQLHQPAQATSYAVLSHIFASPNDPIRQNFDVHMSLSPCAILHVCAPFMFHPIPDKIKNTLSCQQGASLKAVVHINMDMICIMAMFSV